MKKVTSTIFSVTLSLGAIAVQAEELTPVSVATTWYAQAEHGGFYAAKALGIYEKHGLDVDIKMGGPQVNNVQLLVGGSVDFIMGYALQSLNAVEQDIPLVTVAAFFQKDPQSLVVHRNVGHDSLEKLKGKAMRVPTAGRVAYWPWLKNEYGFTDDQLRAYDYSFAPFIGNKQAIQQGYVTNDGYFLQQAGVEGESLLLADNGWQAYSATLDTTQAMIDQNPEVVQKMVEATAEGWRAYFEDPDAANKLIKQDNPEMQDDLLAYSYEKMQEEGILLSDSAEGGQFGNMTRERWKSFYSDMVEAGTLPADLEWQKAFDRRFVKALYGNETGE
ncbi:ABC transporter substrate-binding protein [Hydrocarboniclastica marina]|uniref:ABC transporter substrate-binding protein n=1 Tax=Hydrocarboniclastica marina TaxID=2259620 RepID=A0A4V1D948_9ALTE|nr:ABC transporter substrate-binding protein [Hydrocarboniclastica marina]MAM00131.1 nitrate ABC transporter substrate-binding protein [Alteromonadaceae bacterium]QCF27440.1 ABC transporter substrate-binding protein [Hydrocarboniclastica marina]|tara:strand:- start:965 stop:1957 length:993 start_codon:yes stop_codon:yes gene_type:complete